MRFFLMAAFVALLSAGTSLLLLTLLDLQLGVPAVQHADLAVQMRLHALVSPNLTRIMLALTWMGSIKIFATGLGLVLVFLLVRGRGHAAALLGGSVAGAFVLNETLKLHFHRARPQVPWSIGDEHTFSFPSGHSLFSVVLYGTLVYLALQEEPTARRRWSVLLPAVVLTLGIGISRIYLGMHYPTDVAAGYVAGALWLMAVLRIDKEWLIGRVARGPIRML